MSTLATIPPTGGSRTQRRLQRLALVLILALLAFGLFTVYDQSLRNGRNAEKAVSLLEGSEKERSRLIVVITAQTAQIEALRKALSDAGIPLPPGVTKPIPGADGIDGNDGRNGTDGTASGPPQSGPTGPTPHPSTNPSPDPRPKPTPRPTEPPCAVYNPLTGQCTVRLPLPRPTPAPNLLGLTTLGLGKPQDATRCP